MSTSGLFVDEEAYAELALATQEAWKASYADLGLPCEARLDGHLVIFEKPAPPYAGLYFPGASLILVDHHENLAKSALTHELSHAIMYRCPDTSHRAMACRVLADPRLALFTQMSPEECHFPKATRVSVSPSRPNSPGSTD